MRPTLLLDLDGTLVDSAPDLLAATNRLMRAHAMPPFTEAELKTMIGDGVAALVTRALAARGLPPDPAAVAAFAADYGQHCAVQSRPYPGVRATLDTLARRGWRLAVCTNKPEAVARSLLGTLGLLDAFAAIGGGDSFPTRKPDPAHMRATLAAAGGDPAAAVAVGDHHNDLLAAKGAGIPCVFATWGYGTLAMAQGAAAIAESFAELPELAEAALVKARRRG